MVWCCINFKYKQIKQVITITRAIQTVRSDLTRTGIQTALVEQIDEESQGTRVISRAMILD